MITAPITQWRRLRPSPLCHISLAKGGWGVAHDFTLIGSVVGESVIGHGIGGKDIPIMARLAKGKTLE